MFDVLFKHSFCDFDDKVTSGREMKRPQIQRERKKEREEGKEKKITEQFNLREK